MTPVHYRISGPLGEPEAPQGFKGEYVKINYVHRLEPGRTRGTAGETDVASTDVAHVTLENGFELWIRADDLIQEHGRETTSRDGGRAWEFDRLIPRRSLTQSSERGLAGLAIKALEFFGVDLKKEAAEKLGPWFEDSQFGGYKPGLYHVSLDNDFQLQALEQIPAGGRFLVLLHGTASSIWGSFGKLWETDKPEAKAARERLKDFYDDRVFALQHRSLTESPITNALDLVNKLPHGAEVHLVSHSRGGLVGELLCLAECANELPPGLMDKLFAADRTIAKQLGLSPLDEEASEKRNEAYKDDREKLGKLRAALEAREIKVKRFVRVACPARGTTLASGRLDRWFSMLNFLAQQATGNGIFGDSLDFILGVVKQRTDPRVLPGLEAMMPGSALTRLLQHPDLVTHSDLSVIAGDIKGDSAWSRIKLLVADWFYGADHDLVVNTGSMSGGLKRLQKGARFRQDEGAKVNHFRYFTNEESIGWLVKGLTRNDGDAAGFLPIEKAEQEEPRWREAVNRSRASTTPRPLAIVLPGIMGSALDVRNERVWLNRWAIMRGRLDLLRLKSENVEPVDLLSAYYGPLLEFLAQTHRVEIFPYDWRLSIVDAARKLADQLEILLPVAEGTGQPVHIVAHSMGGLVVRAMIASPKGEKLWRRCLALPNSRFLMLGTPNFGSYEAVRWLTGYNPTEAKLELLDFAHDINEIIDIVRNFPGLLELLPFHREDPDFSLETIWKELHQDASAGWTSADADALQKAQSTWQLLRQAVPDGVNTVYVAGCQDITVAGYKISDEEPSSATFRKRLQFLGVPQGDGTVTWKSGILPNVPVWYAEDTAHDELCTKQQAFPGYLDLLKNGSTTLLPHSPPAGVRGTTDKPAVLTLPVFPPADYVPGEPILRDLGFGISRPPASAPDQPSTPPIQVSIRHGNLAYARNPVLAGHYRGDTIISAEQELDQRLGGALTRRLQLGIYPGPLGTHALFFSEDKEAKPTGAVIVGLGQLGELAPTLLQGGVRDALLEFALQVMQWPDDRFGPSAAIRSAAISCLLVGSGSDGISVRDSIESILRGACQANERLVNKKPAAKKVQIDRIEFIELYEDVALKASDALEQLLEDGQLAGKIIWEPRVVESGEGRLYRLWSEDPPGWWRPLEIIEEKIDDKWLGLRFIASADRARAEMTRSVGQLQLAESFIAQASKSATYSPEAGKTLFEMLLPNRLKDLAPHQGNLLLLVDEVSARYPWEMLEDRWDENASPPAIKAGIVRQLKTQEFRLRPAHTASKTAFIVGMPNLDQWTSFSDLPGARKEAQLVAGLLKSRGFDVKECIDKEAENIIEGLHTKQWRILHLAGHGVHEFPVEIKNPSNVGPGRDCETRKTVQRMSGMVIGKNTFLTPGDVEQMRWTPELVFINCCHLAATATEPRRFNELAANLGVQFIRMGVKAVVAAGWAVNDGAGLSFAQSFYNHMLAGETFGDAVRAAREEIWLRFPGVNTWGAYQCYGDPGFRLRDENGASTTVRVRPYHLPGELVADLENLAERIRVQGGDPLNGSSPKWKEEILRYLARVPQAKREEWTTRADVAAAVGFAWGEIKEWAEAIKWLEAALEGAKGDCPVRLIEQCANFKVRLAAKQWMSLRPQDSKELKTRHDEHVETINQAISQLEALVKLGKTKERLNLLGGSFKRLALVQTVGASRNSALSDMARCYKEAFDFTKGAEAYAWTNWSTAVLLAARLTRKEEKSWDQIEAHASRLREALTSESEANPNFWNCAGIADIDLVHLIAASPISTQKGTGKKAKEPVEAKPLGPEAMAIRDKVIVGYRRAIARGASPREIGSLTENLDFLIEVIKELGDPLLGAIQAIHDTLPLTDSAS